MSTTAATPPIIPISTAQPTTSSLPISAFRHFISRFSSTLRGSLSNRRPWSELLDRSAFCRPDSLTDATSRIRKNLSYFRTNYSILLALVLAFSLLSHPFSLLLLLSLLAAWCFLYLFRPSDPPLVIVGRQFSERETLAGLVVVTVIVVFLTSVGSVVMSAVGVGVAVVCVHGAFRLPEDLFMDYEEVSGGSGMGGVGVGTGSSGFLSFLGGAASSAAAAAGGAQGRV
ncbi:Prenylated rab acceptor family protein [Zostera marina]|uniref:PRA1 family protein n=1 Tax=Zostera marina TaxID=29655 RepID=A0A0K9PXG9_ZOSMR|nr:Prenylated rab acceptor family protein [Zostera marina]